MARVRVICGTNRGLLEQAIDRAVLFEWGRAILVTPTRALAETRLESLIRKGGLPGAIGRPVVAFEDFARSVIQSSGEYPAEAGEIERRLLLEHAAVRLREGEGFRRLGKAVSTRGFLAHVLSVISQLKQSAVDPREFRVRLRGRKQAHWLDAIVADLYEHYQRLLLERGLYDRVGLYWKAAELCLAGSPVLDGISSLALDGFDDFTPSEMRVLRAAGEQRNAIVFGLRLSVSRPSRSDLFAIPEETLKLIESSFEDVETEEIGDAPVASLTAHASNNLFSRDPNPIPVDAVLNVTIRSCHDTTHEVESAGRTIKRLLREGIEPSEMAIVCRDTATMGPVLIETFREFGIPFELGEESLNRSGFAAFVQGIYDAVQGWEHDAVMGVVTSPFFAAPGAPPRGVSAMPALARVAQVVAGRDAWLDRIASMRARLETAADDEARAFLRRIPEALAAACLLEERIKKLAEVDDSFPAIAAASVHAAAMLETLRKLDVAHAIAELAAERIRSREAAAYAPFMRILSQFKVWGGPDEAPVSRVEFAAQLRDAIASEPMTLDRERGGVRCLSPERLRGLEFEHVFLIGFNEGQYPRPMGVNAVYGERDVQALRDIEVYLDGRETHGRREMLLMHHVLAAARGRLWISFAAIDAQGGALTPSAFLTDLCDVAGTGIAIEEDTEDALAPSLDAAASTRDLRNAVFAAGRPESLIAGPFSEVARRARIETMRHSSARFDQYDGVLSDAEVIAGVSARFGTEHRFSARQVEQYARCPFDFFVQTVLGIRADERPEAEFDAITRGLLLHDALDRFHKKFAGLSVVEIDEDAAARSIRDALDDAISDLRDHFTAAPTGVIETERLRLHQVLERYLLQSRKRDGDLWRPVHFEVAFGDTRRMGTDPLSTPEPFRLATPCGTVLLEGRIDRIDEGDGCHRLIDYKTSRRVEQKHITDGVSLQLSLYALAFEELLEPEASCREACFIAVGREQPVEALGREKKAGGWDEREQTAREKVGAIVTAIRSGDFPPTPYGDSCERCRSRAACRFEPSRIQRKEEASS